MVLPRASPGVYDGVGDLRNAVENGFETIAATDAAATTTAAAGEEALEATKTTFEFIAHETATTEEIADRLSEGDRETPEIGADGGQ